MIHHADQHWMYPTLTAVARTLNNSNGSYIYNDSNENKTHWPWPFILIGAGTSIVVLVIINEIKKCVKESRAKELRW